MTPRQLVLAFTTALLLCGHAHAQEDTSPTSIEGLPLEDVRPQGEAKQLAVFYSGDGGWAQLDRGVSARLAAAGVRVIGVSSLRYFWRERQPEEAAGDIARVLRYYLSEVAPDTPVLLIGYSTGADVMPFLVNRLPDLLRARLATVSLIAPGRNAQFVIHVGDWLPGRESRGTPLMPQIERLQVPVLCLYGEGDKSALCPDIPPDRATTVRIGEGHHFSGDYEAIARRILSFAQTRQR
jgi:type IV secretory pathway VirJ component